MAKTLQIYRGISVSEQFAEQRRSQQVTVGSFYLMGMEWLKYRGKQGRHHRFESVERDIFLRKHWMEKYPQLKLS